jgi:ribosomal protein L40E
MAKSKNKKCPNCKNDKCWFQADKCDKCSYSFITKTVEAKQETPEDDDDLLSGILSENEEVAQEKVITPFKKKCVKCGQNSFHRATKCEHCGNEFEIGKVVEKEEEPAKPNVKLINMFRDWGASDIFMDNVQVPSSNPTNGRIVVAAGRPKVELVKKNSEYSTDPDDIFQWCQENINYFYKAESKVMTPQSLYQWLVNLYHPTLIKKDGKLVPNPNWDKIKDLIVDIPKGKEKFVYSTYA